MKTPIELIEAMLDALREAEAAAVAVNDAARQTIFNPTAMSMIRAAIAEAETQLVVE